MNTTAQFKQFVRVAYAWPGGYPLFAQMADGEGLCHTCAQDNAKLILRATRASQPSDWNCVGVDVNWEDDQLTCAHCNQPIETAYSCELA